MFFHLYILFFQVKNEILWDFFYSFFFFGFLLKYTDFVNSDECIRKISSRYMKNNPHLIKKLAFGTVKNKFHSLNVEELSNSATLYLQNIIVPHIWVISVTANVLESFSANKCPSKYIVHQNCPSKVNISLCVERFTFNATHMLKELF